MDSSSENKPFVLRLHERIAASRFLTFSLFLHLIIVVLAGGVVLIQRNSQPPDSAPEARILIPKTDEESVQTSTTTSIQQDPIVPPPATTNPLPSTVITTTALGTPSVVFSAMGSSRAARILDRAAQSPKTLPGAALTPSPFSSRLGAKERLKRAMQMGGTKQSEDAVLSGLRWLKKKQNPDGSWSDEYKPAMTGLALLAFLGHGELPESPEFGPTVKKALDWTLERGSEFDGRMSLTKDGWGGNAGAYEHGILTYAIAEYFALTKDERFESLLRQAVGYIVEGQNPKGGWDYSYHTGPRQDLSVSGWQIQALKTAHLTGLGIPGVDDALDKAMGFIKSFQGNEGGFGYTGPENRVSLTGVGVLCTYFWKQDKDRVVREGIDFLLGKSEVKYKSDKCDLYAWYYSTQACQMFGGSAWMKWNRMFQNEIAGSQSPDGSWPPTQGGHLQPNPGGAGPYYRTTLCVLMLEVFYRYVPINM
jgi:hypothetical protein